VQKNQIELVSKSGLMRLARRLLDAEFDWRIHTSWTLGIFSNFVLLAKRRSGQIPVRVQA
jgi:hypothetical protein